MLHRFEQNSRTTTFASTPSTTTTTTPKRNSSTKRSESVTPRYSRGVYAAHLVLLCMTEHDPVCCCRLGAKRHYRRQTCPRTQEPMGSHQRRERATLRVQLSPQFPYEVWRRRLSGWVSRLTLSIRLRNRTHLQDLIETTAQIHYEAFRSKQLLALKESSANKQAQASQPGA